MSAGTHAPSRRPLVSVVVPARDAAGTLPAAVRSALAQRLPRGWPSHEVVVAVGPSRDGTHEVAERLAAADRRVRVVADADGRTPSVLNAGVRAARGEVVARLDAHARMPDGYLARAVRTLRATGAGNVGAVQRTVPVGPIGAAVATAVASPAGTGGAAYRGAPDGSAGLPRPVETAYLGVFRRSALAAVGGFDERMTRNQDAELNLRLRAAGHAVVLDPALVVDHRPRTSWRALARQYRDYGRWRRVTVRLHPASLRARQLAPAALVVVLVAAAVATLRSRDWRPLGVAVGAYALGVVVAALHAVRTVDLPGGARAGVPDVARALATMHLSWGVGFLVGPPRRALAGDAPVPWQDVVGAERGSA